MSSPTTSPPTPASTSATAAPSKPEGSSAPQATKVALRRKGATLSALRTQTVATLQLPDGTTRITHPGDWLIYQGAYLLAVCAPTEFPGPTYEIVEEGILTLTRADQELIELTAGVGTTSSASHLVAAVQRLARIRIGDVTIPFTPGQLEEIRHRAEKRGQTVAQAMQAVINRIKDELFWRG